MRLRLACLIFAAASQLVPVVSGQMLRVMVLTERGAQGSKVSRFTYINNSADGNERFAGFTIDVMNQVNALTLQHASFVLLLFV